MKNKITSVFTMLVLVAGTAGGLVIAGARFPYLTTPANAAETGKTAGKKKKPLFYRNPMNPAITSPVPAKDEMGMDYVPVYADAASAAGPPGTVRINPVMVQDIGVRTGMAMERTMSHDVRAPGRVDFNAENLAVVHAKFKGWAVKVLVAKTGEQVKKGQPLLTIYSPGLVSTEEEYLLALSNARVLEKSSMAEVRRDARMLVAATRKRLELFDIPQPVIRRLEQTGKVKRNLPITSPFKGTVIHVGVEPGRYLTPGTELYKIADLSTVWVDADIYENDLPWVRVGDKAEMRIASRPGSVFRGTIDYVYPYEDGNSHTVRARMVFANKNFMLKPGMFANVTILGGRRLHVLSVPSEAIVRSGIYNRVFIVKGAGFFEPRKVVTGLESGGYTEIIKGLRPHEMVVTSAQFLIDSESSLNEATAKMLEVRGQANGQVKKTGQNSGKMNMKGMKDMPGMKGMKDMPGMKGMKDMPGMKGMKDMPGMKGMKDMPGMKGMKDMPGMKGMKGMKDMPPSSK
ncbi:cation efflux system protein CusB precursor [bacterium BMS3Bbin14]|nr:cation efflux system protein CusB precursor [bacterium BMS3Bbin14]